MPRRTFALVSILICLAGCEPSRVRPVPSSTEPSPGVTINGIIYPCPNVAFEATHPINGVRAVPEDGPVEELGAFGDLVWTAPHPGPTGRIIVMEMYVGWTHYILASPEPVLVRGIPGTFGTIEDGYGVEWREGPGRCEFFHLELYGATTKADLVRFVDGLRRTG